MMYPNTLQVGGTKVVWLVVDKSGSMNSVRDATISGYNEYLETLKRNITGETLMGLTIFSDRALTGELINIRDMVPMTHENYRPDGMTALYDAIGSAICAIERETLRLGGNSPIVLAIQTDGYENSSREYTRDKIFQMIEERKRRGNWTFVFLGADQDAFAASRSIGVSAGNTFNYSSAETKTTFKRLGRVTANYMCSPQAAAGAGTDSFMDFEDTDEDKVDSVVVGNPTKVGT